MVRVFTAIPDACRTSVAQSRNAARTSVRLLALGTLGIVLGAGATVLTVSYVRAEADSTGVREFFQQEHQRKERSRGAAQPAVYYAPASYAPTRTISLPLFQSAPDGRLAAPSVNLNPFKKQRVAKAKRKKERTAGHGIKGKAGDHTVSGAADVTRTICVRMCDGFHAPVGHLASKSDLAGHEALCKAMNPGVPVQVFKVAAGASHIDDAVSRDGKTYGSLPMAYSHEKSADPACRPAIVQANERRVSLFRDFTLRAGDAVVVNGSARVFNGSEQFPFRIEDFRDFRASGQLSDSERRKIDSAIGYSFAVSLEQTARRSLRMKEASSGGGRNTASDLPLSLRGSLVAQADVSYFAEGRNGQVRVIAPGMFGVR